MAVFFLRRSKGAGAVAVTITGSGSSTYCYVIINGTTYTEAAEGIEVRAGDTIQYYVSKNSGAATTSVTIDGVEMWGNESWGNPKSWTVPKGISQIAITLNVSYIVARGKITITTS